MANRYLVGFHAALPHQADVNEFDRLSPDDETAMPQAAKLYRGPLLSGICDGCTNPVKRHCNNRLKKETATR